MDVAEVVDWDLAARTAARLADRNPSPAPWDEVTADTQRLGPIADELAAAWSGLAPLSSSPPRVVSRHEWISHKLDAFQELLVPLIGADETTPSVHAVETTRRLAGIESGLLVGWLCTRVLGQFDAMITGQIDAAVPVVIGPNVTAFEHRHDFSSEPFRLWVLLRDSMHRSQFQGVPWLAEHFRSLVISALRINEPDPAMLFTGLREAVRTRRESRQRLEEGGMAGLHATDAQRDALSQLTGLLALLDGHAEVMVERAGAEHIPDAEHYLRAFKERRRQMNPLGRYVMRLLGVDARSMQHEAGERFVRQVEDAGGPAALATCWQDPSNLPTMEDVREPERWLARVQADRS